MSEKVSAKTSSFGKEAVIGQTHSSSTAVADRILSGKGAAVKEVSSGLKAFLGSKSITPQPSTEVEAPVQESAAVAISKSSTAHPAVQYAVSGFNIISADQREVYADPELLKHQLDTIRPFYERLSVSPIEIVIDQAGVMTVNGSTVVNSPDPATGFTLSNLTSNNKSVLGFTVVGQTFNTMHVPGKAHISYGPSANPADYAVDLVLPSVSAVGRAGFLDIIPIQKEDLTGQIAAWVAGTPSAINDAQANIDGDSVLTLVGSAKRAFSISGNNIRLWVYPVLFTRELAAAISAQIATGKVGSIAKLLVDYVA